MGIVGTGDFSSGETTIKRVSSDAAVLARCSGYTGESGCLEPEKVPQTLSSTPLPGTTPEQTPFAFVDGVTANGEPSVKLLVLDQDRKMREFTGTAFGDAGGVVDILSGSTPCRMGRQVVYPTGGTDPKLMAYEPGSTPVKLRPLSLRDPVYYRANAQPSVVSSGHSESRLFDNDGSSNGETGWQSASENSTVATAGDVTTITVGRTVDGTGGEREQHVQSVAQVIARKVVRGSANDGISLELKEYLLLDIFQTGDTQPYETIFGTFANDGATTPSGYVLNLYENHDFTGKLFTLRIPRMDTQGLVYRMALKLPPVPDGKKVKSIDLQTEEYFTAPEADKTFTLKLYSGDFAAGWLTKCNWLMPAIKFAQSPWAKQIMAISEDAGYVATPSANNLVRNPGFEETLANGLLTDWVTNIDVNDPESPLTHGAHCGLQALQMDMRGDIANPDNPSNPAQYVQQSGLPVVGGKEYTIEVWGTGYDDDGDYRVIVTPSTGGSTTFPGTGEADYFAASDLKDRSGNRIWQLKRMKWSAPAGAVSCTLRIQAKAMSIGGRTQDFFIDDIAMYPTDQLTAGSAWVLQTFSESVANPEPANHMVRYCFCYAGKSLLGCNDYELMVSNPSEDSWPDVVSDPWQSYTTRIYLSHGGLRTASVATGGSNYQAGDVLAVSGGVGGLVSVGAVDENGSVIRVSIVARGTGYPSASGVAVTGGSAGAAGCTLNTDGYDVLDDYGSYVTHVLVYRRIYTGLADGQGTWGEYRFVKALVVGDFIDHGINWTDDGSDAGVDDMPNGLEPPAILEINNDAAGSARHAFISDGRVYAGCLDWDASTGKWSRPTAIRISSWQKQWAFPVVNTEDSPVTDGGELDGYAVTGSEIRAMLCRNDDKFIFLENEFFLLRGDNPVDGWTFTRLDSIGCISNRSLVDCRSMLIWHDEDQFYSYTGGLSEPISKHKLDSSKIDWRKPHNAVYNQDRYILFCEYDGVNSLLIYDLPTGAWRIRRGGAELNLVGICTDGANGRVYGVTTGGNVVDVFGQSTSASREIWTQYMVISSPMAEAQVSKAVFEVAADTPAVLDLAFEWQGKVSGSAVRTLSVDNTRTQYEVNLNIVCDAIRLKVTHAGANPPTIYYLGFVCDEVPIR